MVSTVVVLSLWVSNSIECLPVLPADVQLPSSVRSKKGPKLPSGYLGFHDQFRPHLLTEDGGSFFTSYPKVIPYNLRSGVSGAAESIFWSKGAVLTDSQLGSLLKEHRGMTFHRSFCAPLWSDGEPFVIGIVEREGVSYIVQINFAERGQNPNFAIKIPEVRGKGVSGLRYVGKRSNGKLYIVTQAPSGSSRSLEQWKIEWTQFSAQLAKRETLPPVSPSINRLIDVQFSNSGRFLCFIGESGRAGERSVLELDIKSKSWRTMPSVPGKSKVERICYFGDVLVLEASLEPTKVVQSKPVQDSRVFFFDQRTRAWKNMGAYSILAANSIRTKLALLAPDGSTATFNYQPAQIPKTW